MLRDGFLQAYRDAVSQAHQSTVEVASEDQDLILGTVVSMQGHILTKASVVKGESDFTCTFSDGDTVGAEIVSLDEQHDLALLKVDEKDNLVPVEWAADAPRKGSFVICPDLDPTPSRAGIVSATQRVIEPDYGFLGVTLKEKDGLIWVTSVMEDRAARKAGVQVNDVIVAIGDTRPKDWEEFQTALKSTKPGDKVVFQLKRGPDKFSMRIALGSRDAGMPTSPNQVGGKFSERRVGFPSVIQHDLTIAPEECGGPLVDLDGNVVGINIARSSRIRSFALPGSLINDLIAVDERGELSFKNSSKPQEAQKQPEPDSPTLAEKVKSAEEEVANARKTLKAARKKLNELKESDKQREEQKNE